MIGFVYLWFDSGRNSKSAPGRRRWCLGSHYGREDDGYITSTGGNHFKAAYRKRPQDFKRRIIERVEGTAVDVFAAEQRWLDFIKPEELRQRYYNHKNTASGMSREDILRFHAADPMYALRLSIAGLAAHEADPTLRIRLGQATRDAHAADPTLGPRIGAAIRAAYAADPVLGEYLSIAIRAAHAADPTIGQRISEALLAAHAADPTLSVRTGQAVKEAFAKLGPEWQHAQLIKRQETLGPEGLSMRSKRVWSNRTEEELQLWLHNMSLAAIKHCAVLGPGGLSARSKKGHAALGPEGRHARAIKSNESCGPEGRRARALKAWETKRAKRALELATLAEFTPPPTDGIITIGFD